MLLLVPHASEVQHKLALLSQDPSPSPECSPLTRPVDDTKEPNTIASFSLLRMKRSKSQGIKSAVVVANLVTKDLSSLVGQLCEAGSVSGQQWERSWPYWALPYRAGVAASEVIFASMILALQSLRSCPNLCPGLYMQYPV